MDDIIYIVIGVVWLAVSIYQSQRKMKQKQQKAAQRNMDNDEPTDQSYEEQSPKKKSFIDQILEEMNKEEEEHTPYSEAVPPPPPQPLVENKSENYYRTKSVENYQSRSDMPESESRLSGEYYSKSKFSKRAYRAFNQEKNKEEVSLFDDYDNEIEDFKFDFDLRNAVIYSEILNRPYT